MIDSVIKCLGTYILIMSLVGIYFLSKNNKPYCILLGLALFISILSRSFRDEISSRYFAVLILVCLVLTVYASYRLQIIITNKRIKLIFYFFQLIVIPSYYIISLFSSFNNRYVFDLLEMTETILDKTQENNIVFYNSKLRRIKSFEEKPAYSGKLFEIPEDFSDLSDLHYSYLTFDGKIYFVTKEPFSFKEDGTTRFFNDLSSNTQRTGVFYSTKKKDAELSVFFIDNKDSSRNLSFVNSHYYSSPGVLTLHDMIFKAPVSLLSKDTNGYTVSGKQSRIYSKNNLLASDREIQASVRIKNIGDNETCIYLGFELYTKDHSRLCSQNYPYNNSAKTSTVLEAKKGNDSIIVDSIDIWRLNCKVALDAKDDLSDIPNYRFADGKILDVKQLSNGSFEIKLSAPLQISLKEGEKVRIHGPSGNSLYCSIKKMQPGEEHLFVFQTRWSSKSRYYSSVDILKEAYYISPVILSYSSDPDLENKILIRDLSITY